VLGLSTPIAPDQKNAGWSCFGESPTQLIGEVRLPIPAEQGQLKRYRTASTSAMERPTCHPFLDVIGQEQESTWRGRDFAHTTGIP